MQGGHHDVGIANDCEAVRRRGVPQAVGATEFDRKCQITTSHGQSGQRPGDNGVNAIDADSIHSNDEINREALDKVYFCQELVHGSRPGLRLREQWLSCYVQDTNQGLDKLIDCCIESKNRRREA